MSNYFEGWYFKHQNKMSTIAFIPGIADEAAFIQVLTDDASYKFDFAAQDFSKDGGIRIGGNTFSPNGIKIDIQREGVSIAGEVRYSNLTPVRYDVMGPLKYFPLECRHGITSMIHDLDGSVSINGRVVSFTGGAGYIEQDSGRSFPKTYMWIQCNDFPERCSVVAATADVPLLGGTFKGCLAIVHYKGREYRLASYLGARIAHCDGDYIVLKQGRRVLDIDIYGNGRGQQLHAPKDGRMTGAIIEAPATRARFRFYVGGKKLFDFDSRGASFEYVV